MSAYLQTLPQALQNEISKYLFLADRKSRLLGKLMLLDNLKRDRKENLIKQFSRDFNNKSFINDWKQFNISHSGELVVFCSGSDMLGVDVEKKALLSWDDYSLFLHPAEQEYIRKANNTVDAFYSI